MKIVQYPDKRLFEKSVECTQDDLLFIEVNRAEMTKLMLSLNGVGLAAVQVGILKRFCILRDGNALGHVIINPLVISVEPEKEKRPEGCLSLPLFLEELERPIQLTATYRDENWVERTAVFMGIEARCLLHEIEHMEGQPIVSKLSPMKQQMYRKKMEKNS